jgi:large subunit ribosomal protein LP2
MRHLAAYLLLQIGGNASPSAADVKKVLSAVGVEADDDRLSTLISELKGKNINEVRHLVLASSVGILIIGLVDCRRLWQACFRVYKPFFAFTGCLFPYLRERQVPSGGAAATGGAPAAGGAAAAAIEEKVEEKKEEEKASISCSPSSILPTNSRMILGGIRRRHGLRSLRLIVLPFCLCRCSVPILHDNDAAAICMELSKMKGQCDQIRTESRCYVWTTGKSARST